MTPLGGILVLSKSLREGSHVSSPVFERQDKWKCFRFWYFIHKADSEYEPTLELYWNNTAGGEKQLWKTTQETLKWRFVQVSLHVDDEIRNVGYHFYQDLPD